MSSAAVGTFCDSHTAQGRNKSNAVAQCMRRMRIIILLHFQKMRKFFLKMYIYGTEKDLDNEANKIFKSRICDPASCV
jgi:hypothetical protein